ncbi:hypothetical protein [Achromobacter deleyi]|uniref:hypothetical protein n=1 Tax=Achromobacter deleyi TaxID=1353891 RepID=UPI001492181D|nr:hypothetical protein [Achromobacter deleyi]QVQ24721.1 hypothetical protein HLG70_17705 [Achromobacter deleyi]UIP20257.1 hypothetical protein LYZ39_25315 [Achromobacter deleyi]
MIASELEVPDSPLGIAPTRTSQADSQELVAFALGTGHVVAYRPELARALGSAVAAIFLGQAIYWQRIAGIGQWFYKLRDAQRDGNGALLPPAHAHQQSWEWELALTRSQQEEARVLLRSHGILEECRRGIPARLYYRVNLNSVEQLLAEKVLKNQQLAEFRQLGGDSAPTCRQDLTMQMAALPPTNTKTSQRVAHQTTTTVPRRQAGQASSELQFEPSLREFQGVCEQALTGLEPESAQAIVDELAGAMERAARGERKPISSPYHYLQTLIQRSAEGTLVPQFSPMVRRRREDRRASSLATEPRLMTATDKATMESELKKAKKMLGMVSDRSRK